MVTHTGTLTPRAALDALVRRLDQQRARKIADACQDAYSVERYTSWERVALELVRRGFDDQEVEALMRSKWMRWAADELEPRNRDGYVSGQVTAAAFGRYIDTQARLRPGTEELRGLVAGTIRIRAPRAAT